MDLIIISELEVWKEKIQTNSVKQSWIQKNLPNLYKYLENMPGQSISEKIYLLENHPQNCKKCGQKTKFLSFFRGYREFCSKGCSNSDSQLQEIKKTSYVQTCLVKYGVENPSCVESVREKIKKSKLDLNYVDISKKIKSTCMENWGVDNPSKSHEIKERKKITTLKNWGVDNPFKSEEIKEKIKQTNIINLGVCHPLKSDEVKEKLKQTSLNKWNSTNYKSSEIDKLGTIINLDSGYVRYLGDSIYLMSCHKGHNYEIKYDNYYHRKKIGQDTCSVCQPISSGVSITENQILDFIKSFYTGKIVQSYRDSFEIDIFFPELNFGIEFNGVYWHSEIFKDSDYHLNKLEHFKQRGIKIVNIWEDDWTYKREIVKSQIRNWIGLTGNKIFARNCEVRKLKKTAQFLDSNHIQGSDNSTVKLGLFLGDELVSVMTFDRFEGRKKMKESQWNLSRYCSKINTTVVGGASKLLKFFVSNWKPERIISYADKTWSTGQLYYKLNFKLIDETKPDYKYLLGDRRIHKSRFRKSITGISESNLDRVKVWDCGKMKFELFI
jgi:hypothetical protein